ncbi:DUF2087 domain-containing protein [Streptomyces exfoliatus]|uniref:DUF2087 domain-containing protein n=1 Tax=Streptomyces TaxID=1883 RepID=UPI0004CC5964|nr:DUF2087 domain-containing protein [Streptomyces exfoliatus]
MTSHHPAPLPASRPARPVADLFSADGRLKAIPRKPARREALLAHLAATLFEDGRDYREPEVNEALLAVHEDFPALRRYLVIGGFLGRTKDGSTYRLRQQTGFTGGAIPAVA